MGNIADDWKELLRKAVKILECAGISFEDWSFGGGTALMLYYEHRESKDIDIFFTNPQFLPMVSPRLNDVAESISDDYSELSNFVKIKIGDREIDFIVAPNISGIQPEKKAIDNLLIKVEQPEEIIAKKIFYRTESLKIRDFVDLYTVLKDQERKDRTIRILRELLEKKRNTFLKRANFLKESLSQDELQKLLLKKEISFDFIDYCLDQLLKDGEETGNRRLK